MRCNKTAAYLLEMQRAGLARSTADVPNLISISTGKILSQYPDYWCNASHCDCPDRNCGSATGKTTATSSEGLNNG